MRAEKWGFVIRTQSEKATWKEEDNALLLLARSLVNAGKIKLLPVTSDDGPAKKMAVTIDIAVDVKQEDYADAPGHP